MSLNSTTTSSTPFHLAALAVLAASLAGCACADGSPLPAEDVDRAAAASIACDPPAPPGDDRAALVADNDAFAIALFRAIAAPAGAATPNVFFSPYSISLALAMTYAGARGDTASEIARGLHFTLPPARLHAAFGALDVDLASRGADVAPQGTRPFRLRAACSLWAEDGPSIEAPFLATLADDYRSDLGREDFAHAPESARLAINQWVSDHTEGAIADLFGPGSIGPDARLVLADAIDFEASWMFPFDPDKTARGDFHAADGTTSSVPFMHLRADLRYAEGDGWQAVSIPYQGGDVAMVAIVPSPGVAGFAKDLDAAKLRAIEGALAPAEVTLAMPKFRFDPGTWSVREALVGLGLPSAFDPARADFSGITTRERLALGDVVHRAFIDVDENGTHAAAATGVVIVGTSLPSRTATVTLNRPFLYAIRDVASGTLLFLGQATSL